MPTPPGAVLMEKPLPGPPPKHGPPQPRRMLSARGLQASIHNPIYTANSSSSSSRASDYGNTRRAIDFDPRALERHRCVSDVTAKSSLVSSTTTTTSGTDTIMDISREDSNNRAVSSGVVSRNSAPAAPRDDRPGYRRRSSNNRHDSSLNPIYQAKLQVMRAHTQKLIHHQHHHQHQQQQQQQQYRQHHASYPSPAPSRGSPSSFDSQPASPALLSQFQELQRQVQFLKARNAKLGAENMRLAAAKGSHEATIDNLRGQVRAREAEHARLAERFRGEAARRDDEVRRARESLAQLKEEKWRLVGRVAKLDKQLQLRQQYHRQQQHRFQSPPQVAQGGRAPVLVDCSRSSSRSSYGSESRIGSVGPGVASSPLMRSGAKHAPSLFSPLSSHVGGESVYAETPSPCVRAQWRQRPPSPAESQATNESLVEDELAALSDQLAVHYERYSKEYQAMTAQLAVLEEDKAQLEKDLCAAREQQVVAANRNRELESKLASQASMVQSSMVPIPELPVLTYASLGSVWFDRVTSSFKYWGLFEFISQPDVVTSPPNPAREARRLRAAVLLKRAVEDDILEDLMYLHSQRSIANAHMTTTSNTSSSHESNNFGLESPYYLFQTISTLKRTVPTSLMDFNWLERITDTDFVGIEGYASLVLCLDRRHSKLYGTSVDHYEALIPKIQENIRKRFPDLEKPLAELTSTPKRWWHLGLWMSRLVKRRQGRIPGDDV